MDKKTNKFINVAYELYDVTEANATLIEKTSTDNPFIFISGFGVTLEDFEKAVENLNEGEEFDFTLTPEQAYGDYVEERVLDLDKQIFTIDGHFDSERIHKDAIVPLQNEDGNRFMGHVLDISEDKVKVDLNHPLAGKTLHFKGHIVDSHEATNEELEQYAKLLSGEGGCGGNCGKCSGDCEGNCDGGCGDGNGCDKCN